jgi:ABC-2 type transport system ATP-binding protein
MIDVDSLYKSYGTNQVLKGVDLVVKQACIQGLLGANGSGKSTLISVLSMLNQTDKGTVKIDKEVISVNKYEYRRKVGYVFEKPIYVDKFSAKEYLGFVSVLYQLPKRISKERIIELLSFMDLPIDNKKYIESYSKGMKNKVSLAAALIHQPKYLILDEPFDGIDFMSVQKIIKLFRQMADKGATILITSHQYDIIAEVCDKFALLKDGVIQFNLSMPELEALAQQGFSKEKVPVKAYLESLMSNDNQTQTLSWL